MTNNKRKDNKNRILKDGEYQRPNGTYEYRWRDKRQKRHVIYAKTLIVLREKQKQILKDFLNGLNVNNKITVDDLYIKWKSLKRGLKIILSRIINTCMNTLFQTNSEQY